MSTKKKRHGNLSSAPDKNRFTGEGLLQHLATSEQPAPSAARPSNYSRFRSTVALLLLAPDWGILLEVEEQNITLFFF